MQPIADYNVFFDGAEKALEENASVREALKNAETDKSDLESRLKETRDALSESIKAELSTRRDRIRRTYDTELDDVHAKLTEVQRARRKAKDKGMKERITEATSQLHAENRDIKGKITEDFRSRDLPEYCFGRLFNVLYFPENIADYALLFLLQIGCYIAIPTVVALISGTSNLWVVVGVFAVDILLFNAAYFNVLKTVVYKNYDILSEAVIRRGKIRDNDGKIDEITEEIVNDPNEEYYDLGEYDHEIESLRQEIEKVETDKKEALDTFDTDTSSAITDEMTNEVKPHIDELTAQVEEAAAKVKELEEAGRLKKQVLDRDYEPYLGKKFMNHERIEALREIINHGTATNITEAKEEYEHRMEG